MHTTPKPEGLIEVVDDRVGLGLRRAVVGPLETNCWTLFCLTSSEAILVDPGDEPGRLIDAASDLAVVGVVLTHTHWDHVLAVPEITDRYHVPVFRHEDDGPVWPHELDHLRRNGHFDAGTATARLLEQGHRLRPDPAAGLWDGRAEPLRGGDRLSVGRIHVDVIHTPGHTPGGVSLHAGSHLLTGDTLFPGGPGLTGWPLSDFPTIIASVRQLLRLPAATAVHPGHGPSTTVGAQRSQVDEWAARGW